MSGHIMEYGCYPTTVQHAQQSPTVFLNQFDDNLPQLSRTGNRGGLVQVRRDIMPTDDIKQVVAVLPSRRGAY